MLNEFYFTGDTRSHLEKAEKSSPVELYQSAKTVASALESRDREARLRFYFREISKLYLSLIGALSLRMCAKVDMGLLEGADNKKGEIINRINNLTRDSYLNERIQDALKGAVKLIKENNETGAQPVLLMILNSLSFEIKHFTGCQSYGQKVVIWFDEKDLFWKIRQGQLINYELVGESGEISMRVSVPKNIDFLMMLSGPPTTR